ncbi:MAG: hypothetical protein E6706_00875 [Anaerococcus hydrogenalis]|nr:hypothetical protein [Anaerococcus hydrogenalis]
MIVIAGLFLYFYISDRRVWQKNQDKQFERSNEINDKLTEIIAKNTSGLDLYETSLNKHSCDSKQSFDDLNSRVLTYCNLQPRNWQQRKWRKK